ncbi:MAG: hypothetical protein U1E05_02185, partial [Patescibacteria group bacterium]|nr:hypothetical protein [Patescibacteria group bacterium]
MMAINHYLPRKLACLAACVWITPLLCGPAGAEPANGPPAATRTDASAAMSALDVTRAIRDLGHDDFSVRQRATHSLWLAGDAAEPALREAVQSTDPEVAARARWILDRLRFGLLPDTPPQLAGLIEQFRSGDARVQRVVLKRLIDLGRVEVATRLLQSVPEVDARKQLQGEMVREVARSARRMIAEGNHGLARQLLEVATQSDSGCRDLAAFLLLQGDLKDELQRRAEPLKQQPSEQEARLLGYLLRAAGDLPAALQVFDGPVNDANLARGVLAELDDWQELAKRWDEA